MNRSNRTLRAALGAAWLVFLVIALGSIARGGVPSTVVISTRGDPAPDGVGAMFGHSAVPCINDSGQVAFGASLSGTTVDTQTGVFRGIGGPLTQIAHAGAAVPEGGGDFSTFFIGVSLNSAGQSAWTSELVNTPGDDDDRGIYRGDGTTQVKISRRQDPVPSGGVFISYPFSHRINDAGQACFVGFLTGSSFTGIYRGSGGAITEIARDGQALAGIGNIGNITYGPSQNQLGQVGFCATLTATAGGTSDNDGVFKGDGTSIVQIARKGQAAPEGDGVLGTMVNVFLNDSGQAVFRNFLTGTSGGTNNDLAIYRGDGVGPLVKIAHEGDAAPGGDGLLSFMFVPTNNNAGQSAFTASLRSTSLGAANDSAIYRGDGVELREIAREGNFVPGGNGKFGELDSFDDDTDFDMNHGGQLAFFANLTNTSGGATDNGGIFFFDQNLGMFTVARKGDSMLGSTITSLRIAPGLFGEELGGLNNFGQVAFQFSLADNRDGIAVWSANIPEPASGGLSLLVLSVLRRCRRS